MVSGSRACLTFIPSDHPHRPSRHFDGALDVILEHVRRSGRPDVTNLDQVAALARRRDRVAWDALELAGEALGCGLAAVVNLLNLGLVIIHTEAAVLNEEGPYQSAALRTLRAHAFSTAAASCKILWRLRTDELEGRGAASMAFHPLPDVFPMAGQGDEA
jgi:predicted NBD/HSP70 family sugar kinase